MEDKDAQTTKDEITADSGLEIIEACPMCCSSRHEVAFSNVKDVNYGADDGEFTFLRCGDCQSLYLRERPVGTRLQKAYAGYYTRADLDGADEGVSVKALIRSSYVKSRYGRSPRAVSALFSIARKLAGKSHLGTDRQYRFAPKAPAKVLDYGCGSGAYLLRLLPLGHELHGLEYDAHLIGGLAEHGIHVGDVTEIEDTHWHGEFDHITLSHVLEHVPDPNELLARLFRWLKPGGTLFVELPSADATGLEIFGRDWSCLEAPRHFAMPSRSALVDAFTRAGFGELEQYVEPTIRKAMWDSSLSRCDAERKPHLKQTMAAAAVQDQNNTEYLTFVATKPSTI